MTPRKAPPSVITVGICPCGCGVWIVLWKGYRGKRYEYQLAKKRPRTKGRTAGKPRKEESK